MLCLNEADRLPRSLAAVDHFAEWIIFDTGSTDDSIAIARQAGATVIESPWEGFSLTRIKHFQSASQPWIFWIDADEVITPSLVDELRQMFTNGHTPQHNAYMVNRMIHFEGKWIRHGDWFPDWNVRLFQADSWKMQERAVHESLEIHGSIGKLQNHLEHHSFRSWADRYARAEKYATLWAEMQHGKGKKSSAFTLYFRTIWRFLRGYIFKLGFLDGWMGFRVAISNAKVTHLKYSLLKSK